MRDRIVEFIRTRASNGAVIGISGGLDSALAATLCAEALGPDKVLGLIMPSAETPEQDTKDGIGLCKSLGIEYKFIDISKIVGIMEEHVGELTDQVATANLRPRVRMTLLYYHANLLTRLVIGTSNRSELLIGYFTKYGDGAADILPLGGLYKTQAAELARQVGVPQGIIEKAPSAGLWPGQTDEKELGISYQELDEILMNNRSHPLVNELRERARHKLALPEVCKV